MWLFRAKPEDCPECGDYVFIPEWNGWRLTTSDSEASYIAIPLIALEKLIELAKESETWT